MPVNIDQSIIPPHVPKGRQRFDRTAALERALGLFWQKGFAPTTVGELCTAMGINPPSLYGAFGNKAQLFMEAVEHYERTYWDAPWKAFESEPDIRRAVADFFSRAAAILMAPDAPCGCVVVTGAINVPPEDRLIADALRDLREQERVLFARRLEHGVANGQLDADTDVDATATALLTLLEGMSIEAAGASARTRLDQVAACAVNLLGKRIGAQ